MNREEFDAVMTRVMDNPSKSELKHYADYQYAVLKVYEDFAGRDWRRIKREVRKATKGLK